MSYNPQSNRSWKYISMVLAAVLGISALAFVLDVQQLRPDRQQEQSSTLDPLGLPLAYGAGTLTNVFAIPSDNTFSEKSYYTVAFTTATTGAIKNVTIAFPFGFNVDSTKLIQAQNIGIGTISASGQTITYTVNSSVSTTSAGKAIKIILGDITNNKVASNHVAVTTTDGSGTVIDGPTNSAVFTLTQVTSSMIASNSITSAKIVDGAVTSSDLADGAVTSSKIAAGAVSLNVFEYGGPISVTANGFGSGSAECPVGYHATSGGWNIGVNNFVVTRTDQFYDKNTNQEGWYIDVWNNNGFTLSGTVQVFCTGVTS